MWYGESLREALVGGNRDTEGDLARKPKYPTLAAMANGKRRIRAKRAYPADPPPVPPPVVSAPVTQPWRRMQQELRLRFEAALDRLPPSHPANQVPLGRLPASLAEAERRLQTRHETITSREWDRETAERAVRQHTMPAKAMRHVDPLLPAKIADHKARTQRRRNVWTSPMQLSSPTRPFSEEEIDLITTSAGHASSTRGACVVLSLLVDRLFPPNGNEALLNDESRSSSPPQSKGMARVNRTISDRPRFLERFRETLATDVHAYVDDREETLAAKRTELAEAAPDVLNRLERDAHLWIDANMDAARQQLYDPQSVAERVADALFGSYDAPKRPTAESAHDARAVIAETMRAMGTLPGEGPLIRRPTGAELLVTAKIENERMDDTERAWAIRDLWQEVTGEFATDHGEELLQAGVVTTAAPRSGWRLDTLLRVSQEIEKRADREFQASQPDSLSDGDLLS